MPNELFEKWRAESQEMVDNAIANSQQSKNKVHIKIDSVGAIEALVFGEEGIVSVEPCYDDQVAGKFAHRLSYPDEKRLKQLFSEKTGITDISFTDDRFIEFVMQEIEEQSKKGAEWNGVSWNNTYSRYENVLYDSKQEAINAIWTSDVFCGKRKEKSPLQQREGELSAAEAEAKTISEAEALRDELEGKKGQNKGEE